MAAGSGREQPQTPSSQQNFQTAPAQANQAADASAVASTVGQVAPVDAQLVPADDAAKAGSKPQQPALISLAAPTEKQPAQMQVDQQAVKSDVASAADQVGSIPVQQSSQQVKHIQPSEVPEKVVVPTPATVMVCNASNNGGGQAAAQAGQQPFDDRQQQPKFYVQQVPPPAANAQQVEEAKQRRPGSGAQEHFRLTASNLDKHEQQLIFQKGQQASRSGAPPTQSNTAPAMQASGNMAQMPGQKPGQITVPSSSQNPNQQNPQAQTNQQWSSQPQPNQQIMIQAGQNQQSSGRPSGSTSQNPAAMRKQKSQTQQSSSQQPVPNSQQPGGGQSSTNQINAAGSQQQPMGGGVDLSHQHAATLQQQQFQKYQHQLYQQQLQQRQLQHQNSTTSMQGAPNPQQAQQEAILRHQLAAQQASQGHGNPAQAHQAYHSMSQHFGNEPPSKMVANSISRRVNQCFNDKLSYLQTTEKQNMDSLAKQIKKEEFTFFLKNDDTKYKNVNLLEQKNQRMDEYISFMAENGGRVIPKQPEPVPVPNEAPVIVEMRLMHMEMVEEAYWKRAMASRLARQCQVVAIRKAQERVQRQREEQQRKEEAEKQEAAARVAAEQRTAAGNIPSQSEAGMPNNASGSGLKATVMIDTNQGVSAFGGQDNADFIEQPDGFGGDLFDPADNFADPIMDPVDIDAGIDELSMHGQGMDMIDHDMDIMADQPHDTNMGSGFHVDEEADKSDDNFDPEQEIRRQEEILEQQRIEENKKQELERLRRIEEIEKLGLNGAAPVNQILIPQKNRVLASLLEDSDIDSDREDQIAALEDELMNIDLVYLRPNEEDSQTKKDRELKQATDAEKRISPVANQDVEMSVAWPEDQSLQDTAPQSAQSKTIVNCAKTAIKQQLDKLAQMILDNKDQSASQLLHDEKFNQALGSVLNQDQKGKPQPEGLLDKIINLTQNDQQINLYMLPGIDDYDFDLEQDLLDFEEDENDPCEDMNKFFTDIKEQDLKKEDKQQKLRPPSVLGHEQQRLYEELEEINELAPERNDLTHMDHLCKFWVEREKEEIEDKRNIIRFLENMKDDESQQMERRQRQSLQQSIQQHMDQIEKLRRDIDKYQRPEYKPKNLHKERFTLTGGDLAFPPQPNLAPQEFSFIKWYYALFPDQWRLIADIVNYHPLTRGHLHTKEYMAREYFNRLDNPHKDMLQGRQKIQMQPWRETGLPWLINGRHGCLMNSLTYINRSHVSSIHKMKRMSRKRREARTTYKLIINQQGCLELLSVQESQPMEASQAIVQANLLQPDPMFSGKKRIRGELADSSDHEWNDSTEQDEDSVNIMLEQMLSRRRKNETQMAEEDKKGTLVKNDIYRDRPLLKELMVEIAYKRRRIDENTSQIVPTFTAFAFDPVKVEKDELNTKTPMWYALQNNQSCQMTIRVQHSTMFWLGYFIRRNMHEENLFKLKKIQENNLKEWEEQCEIKNFFLNQAKLIFKEASVSDASRQLKDREELANLQREIMHFLKAQGSAQQTRADQIQQVNDLWDGKSPYQYDKEQRAEYIKQEKDNYERISNVMSQKSKHLWEELQFYWFQVNKNLHPRYRKVDTEAQSSASQNAQQMHPQQQFQGSNMPIRPPVPNTGSSSNVQQISTSQAAGHHMVDRQQSAQQQMVPVPGFNGNGDEGIRKTLSIVDSQGNQVGVQGSSRSGGAVMAQQPVRSGQSSQQMPSQGGNSTANLSQSQQYPMQNVSGMNPTQIGHISAQNSIQAQQAYQSSNGRGQAPHPQSAGTPQGRSRQQPHPGSSQQAMPTPQQAYVGSGGVPQPSSGADIAMQSRPVGGAPAQSSSATSAPAAISNASLQNNTSMALSSSGMNSSSANNVQQHQPPQE